MKAFLRKSALIGHRSISFQSACAKIKSSWTIAVECCSAQKLYSSAIALLQIFDLFVAGSWVATFFVMSHTYRIYCEPFIIHNYIATLNCRLQPLTMAIIHQAWHSIVSFWLLSSYNLTAPCAYDHTTLNTPVLVWSPKLSSVGPVQYLDGWPPGNHRCCRLSFFFIFSQCLHCLLPWSCPSFYFYTFLSRGLPPLTMATIYQAWHSIVPFRLLSSYNLTATCAYDHTTLNTPVLVWSPKLSSVGPIQYLDGWPPGNHRCCRLPLSFLNLFLFLNALTHCLLP